MRIDFEYLKQNPDSQLVVPIDWPSEPFEVNGEQINWSVPLSGELVFQAVENHIRIDGNMEGTLKVSCVRCLQEFNFPIKTDFSVDVTQEKPEEATGDTYSLAGNEIDLEPILMEQILFNLPINLVCSEECRGLCPQCGQDLNQKDCKCESKQTDPRWDALKKFMEGKEG